MERMATGFASLLLQRLARAYSFKIETRDRTDSAAACSPTLPAAWP